MIKFCKQITDDDINKAQVDFEEARARLYAMQDHYGKTTVVPRMRKLIGKCFKYRSSYSCPRQPSDYWFIYAMVTGIRDGEYVAFTVAKDSRGVIQINPKDHTFAPTGYRVEPMEGWREISIKEFNAAVKRIMGNARNIVAGGAT